MKRKIKWKRWLIATAVAVLVIAGALYTWYLDALSAVNERRQDVVFVVESGGNIGQRAGASAGREPDQEQFLGFSACAHPRPDPDNGKGCVGAYRMTRCRRMRSCAGLEIDADEAKTNQTLITFPEGQLGQG